MAGPTASGTPPPSPASTVASPGASSPPPRPGPSRRTLLAILVVVLVLVAFLGLALSEVVHPSSSASAASTPVASYSAAKALADPAAAQVVSGPWNLYAALGADVTQGYTNTSGVQRQCTSSQGVGTLSVPGYTGNYSSGDFAFWYFDYFNAANTMQLTMLVADGRATEYEVSYGPNCGSPGGGIQPIPANVLDSTQVAAALLGNASVESFLHSYSSANASFTLLNESHGSTPAAPRWSVEYTACSLGLAGEPLSGAQAVGGSLEATVNATSGALIGGIHYEGPGGLCSGAPSKAPVGSAFAAGNPRASTCPTGDTYALNGCQAGDYVYTLSVEASSVTLSSVLFEVEHSNGAVDTLSTPGGFSILNISGDAVAQVSLGTALDMTNPWTTYYGSVGPTSPLTSTDTIVIDMGTSNPTGTGLLFLATGTGDYTGTTSPVALP